MRQPAPAGNGPVRSHAYPAGSAAAFGSTRALILAIACGCAFARGVAHTYTRASACACAFADCG